MQSRFFAASAALRVVPRGHAVDGLPRSCGCFHFVCICLSLIACFHGVYVSFLLFCNFVPNLFPFCCVCYFYVGSSLCLCCFFVAPVCFTGCSWFDYVACILFSRCFRVVCILLRCCFHGVSMLFAVCFHAIFMRFEVHCADGSLSRPGRFASNPRAEHRIRFRNQTARPLAIHRCNFRIGGFVAT